LPRQALPRLPGEAVLAALVMGVTKRQRKTPAPLSRQRAARLIVTR
jgi:hypothetical protein